jgi:hypothetical protein
MPTHLWVEAKIRDLSSKNIGVYVTHKGERNDGIVLLKIANLTGECKLLTQQRDLDGALGWVNALGDDIISEAKADEYIKRSIVRDPDQWVIEAESPEMDNLFDN